MSHAVDAGQRGAAASALWIEKGYTMIYSVTGTLIHTEPGAAVVDVGGVAFRCMTSMCTLRALPRLSEKVTLYTLSLIHI